MQNVESWLGLVKSKDGASNGRLLATGVHRWSPTIHVREPELPKAA